MPADYRSTAQALALSPSPRESPSLPPWSSSSASPTTPRRRPSNHLRRTFDSPNDTFARRMLKHATLLGQQTAKAFMRLTALQRLGVILAIAAFWTMAILFVVYSHSFFAWLEPTAESWRALSGGSLIIILIIFVTSFPPLIGYSTVATVSGFVYGFPFGWPPVAIGCTAGALGAFVASRTILSSYVQRMVGRDHRFLALGQVLRQEGIWYLTAIRFCPLPFSLSNGFLATIPTITPTAFAISTALSSPKLLVHVFIGSRLALLAEKGDKMSAGDKAVNYISMAIGGSVGLAVAFVIYRRTMARAAVIAREQHVDSTAAEEGEAGYADADSALMDPEDAAVLMSDDDISLWERDDNGYHDEQSDEEGNGRKNSNGSSH